jgi:hypothetical protein
VSGITFHHDGSTDLAVIRAQRVDFQPWQVFTLNMVLGQAPNDFDTKLLAVESEIDLLTPGEQVLIVGYPGIRGVPERPVLFNGIISSDPRYPAMFGETTFENSVLCHSFSWGGMSGAPVLGFSEAIGQTKIIGINAGHIEGTGNFGEGSSPIS